MADGVFIEQQDFRHELDFALAYSWRKVRAKTTPLWRNPQGGAPRDLPPLQHDIFFRHR